MNKKLNSKKYIIGIGVSALSGLVILVLCSIVQKIIAGFNPFLLKGYYIPILFGSLSGGLLGFYMAKIRELNAILWMRVKTLESFLPICSSCKKIRINDAEASKIESWDEIESYLSKKTAVIFSHSLCPECAKKLYPDLEIYHDLPGA